MQRLSFIMQARIVAYTRSHWGTLAQHNARQTSVHRRAGDMKGHTGTCVARSRALPVGAGAVNTEGAAEAHARPASRNHRHGGHNQLERVYRLVNCTHGTCIHMQLGVTTGHGLEYMHVQCDVS
jgi:hypothetical protein